MAVTVIIVSVAVSIMLLVTAVTAQRLVQGTSLAHLNVLGVLLHGFGSGVDEGKDSKVDNTAGKILAKKGNIYQKLT